jgi:hypothetical protein
MAEINAFALPGGAIFVNLDAIQAAESGGNERRNPILGLGRYRLNLKLQHFADFALVQNARKPLANIGCTTALPSSNCLLRICGYHPWGFKGERSSVSAGAFPGTLHLACVAHAAGAYCYPSAG